MQLTSGRNGAVTRRLALGLLRMMTPLGSAWSDERVLWRPPGWLWGADPMPSRGPQPDVPSPTDGVELLIPESPPSVSSPSLPPSPPRPSPTAEPRVEPIIPLSLPLETSQPRLTPLGRRAFDEAGQTPNRSSELKTAETLFVPLANNIPLPIHKRGERSIGVELQVLVRWPGGCLVRMSLAAGEQWCR